MSKMSFVTDMILDTFKRVLVRFKNAKFGFVKCQCRRRNFGA